MKTEHIPCWNKAFPDGTLHLIPRRQVNLRPGDYAIFSANPPEVVIHRVWFGRRWFTVIRAYLQGTRAPDLTTTIWAEVRDDEER